MEKEKTEIKEELKGSSYEHNLHIMETVEKTLNKQRQDDVLSLIIFLCGVSLWIILVALWDYLGKPIEESTVTILVEILAVIMFVIIFRRTNVNINQLGVNTRNLKSTLIRATLISIGLIAFFAISKMILKPGEEIFDWNEFELSYLLTCALQEFIARGFLLTILIRICHNKHNKLIALICSSLMFACLHLFYGFWMMIASGILSFLLGLVYLKDKNIWGVTIIHFVFGTFGCMIHIIN